MTEEANVPSKEGLSVHFDISLLFSLNPDKAAQVYKTIGPDYSATLSAILATAIEKKSALRGIG